jgi:hypothetical protein
MSAAHPNAFEYRLPKFLPTQEKFRQMVLAGVPGDPDAIGIFGYFGGWGSGKTTVLKWIAFDAMTCFPRLKVLICRDTFSSLNLTTKPEFLGRMVEGDPKGRNVADILKHSWREKEQCYTHRNGSQCFFGGLDKVDKWGSTEFGLILIDEGALIGEQDIPFLISRLRQPSPICDACFGETEACRYCKGTGDAWGPNFRRALVLISNHVYTQHHLHRDFVGQPDEPPKKNHFYVETSSFENSPEEGGHLPKGYLQSLEASGDPRMVSVYMGRGWGVVPRGVPVYPWVPSLKSGEPWHERQCVFDKSRPLIPSIDFGYRFPFVTFHQLQMRNRWRTLGEFSMPNSRTDELCYGALDYIRRRFEGAIVPFVTGDPAAWQNRSDAGGARDGDVVEKIFSCNFRSLPSTDDSKLTRRISIRQRLGQTSGEEPMYAVDPQHCPRLCEAMRGMYRYPELKTRFTTTNAKEELVVEEHPYCDVVHSVEYFALNYFEDQKREGIIRSIGKIVEPIYRIRSR